MEQKTPEQKAEERYRMPSEQNSGFDWYDDECDRAERRRQGYVACYREEVEPRDRIIQELILALERCVNENGEIWGGELQLIAKAKEQLGIEPSNQK